MVSNEGDKAFANNQADSTVTVIDLTSGEVTNIVERFSQPKFVYVTNFEGNDIYVLNTETLEIEKTLKGIPSVRTISIDVDSKYLYGAYSSKNTINIVYIATEEVVKSI